jgi:hypothetical protein
MVAGVVEQVDEYALDAATIHDDDVIIAHFVDDEDVCVPEPCRDSLHEGTQVLFFTLVLTGTGVEATELEQIENGAVKTAHLRRDDVDGLLVAFRQFVATRGEYVDGGSE